jgi:hypothetical protein
MDLLLCHPFFLFLRLLLHLFPYLRPVQRLLDLFHYPDLLLVTLLSPFILMMRARIWG